MTRSISIFPTREDGGTKFFANAFDFRIEWIDKFKDVGKPMLGIVERYDQATDVCKVSQYFSKVLEELYPKTSLPKKSTFKVLFKKEDPLTLSPFYQLKDAFGLQHRFYTNSYLEVGAEVELTVIDNIDSGNGKGHLEFEISVPEVAAVKQRRPRIPVQQIETEQEESDFGIENTTTEFKSSIVFVPYQSQPDIDQQIKTIMKTIAGFLNKEGGTIYIGVNDSGKVCGIEADFPHLNDSDKDEFEYKENTDSYQLKLQNSIRKAMGTNSVLEFIDIKFDRKRDHTYCIITVEKCSFPVFVNGTQLYQRMGNRDKPAEKRRNHQFLPFQILNRDARSRNRVNHR